MLERVTGVSFQLTTFPLKLYSSMKFPWYWPLKFEAGFPNEFRSIQSSLFFIKRMSFLHPIT